MVNKVEYILYTQRCAVVQQIYTQPFGDWLMSARDHASTN